MGKIKAPTKRIRKNIVPPKSKPKVKNVKSSEETILVEFPADKWIFVQNSPLSSVPLQDDGHTIKEGYEKFVNDNYNSFSNEIVKKYKDTWNGAFIFKNHNDNPDETYGIVTSVKLRKIKSKSGDFRYVPEILMAICLSDSPDSRLVKKIEEDGTVKTSMGVMAVSLKCSLCGSIKGCNHITYSLGEKYSTPYGYDSVITALVNDEPEDGDESDINYDDYDRYPVYWYENSILDETPAYKGVTNSFVYKFPKGSLVDNKVVIEMPKKAYTRSGIYGKNALQIYERKGLIKIHEKE